MAHQLVSRLQLAQHPEGGHYREYWRSSVFGAVPWTSEERTSATAIYFLLEAGQFSRLHRIKSDEIWAFHSGQALEVVEVDGAIRTSILERELRSSSAERNNRWASRQRKETSLPSTDIAFREVPHPL